jgi:hypothetical protein
MCTKQLFVFSDYTELSTRARLTLSGACPRRNSSRGIIGPGVTENLKLMSDDDFESGSKVCCFPMQASPFVGSNDIRNAASTWILPKMCQKIYKKFVRILFKTCYDAHIMPLMICFHLLSHMLHLLCY